MLTLLLAVTITTSGEQQFAVIGDFEQCPTKIKVFWGERERISVETFKLDPEKHCRKWLKLTHTFTDRAPRRIDATFYRFDDVLGHTYLDVNFK